MAGGLTKEHLKAAVFTAIKEIRNKQEATVLYHEWLKTFGNESQFSLVRFIKYFCEQHQLTDAEKVTLRDSLRGNLFAIKSNKKPTSPPPKPEKSKPKQAEAPRNAALSEPKAQPAPEKKPQATSNLNDAESATFIALFEMLIKKAKKAGIQHDKLIDTLEHYLKESVLPINRQAKFIDWCQGSIPSGIQTTTTKEEMSSIIHHTYNALCEEIGPIDADIILSTSVEQIKLLDCADDFPPENFL